MGHHSASVFLALAVVGTLVPGAFLVRYFAGDGSLAGFLPAAFANAAGGGLTTDLVISSVAFWSFLFPDARRRGVARPWLYVVLNLAVGLSCALPLYLWARARAPEAR